MAQTALIAKKHNSLTMHSSADFVQGFYEGLADTQPLPRFDIRYSITEQGILEIVENALAMYQDGELSEDLLRHDIGLITGWIMRGMTA